MLFHGIPHNLVDRVCKQGLDPRRGGTNVGKMFGVGTYLADLSSKSDIYTTPNDQGERCLLWVRACLGEAYQADKRNQDMTIPPERDDRKGPLNSVVALTKDEGGAVEHREFIVYKESQLLPQYAVWYKHRSACVCTHCYKKAFIECEDERDIVVTDCRTVGRILKAVRKKTDSGELPGFTSENVALMDCEGDILDDEDQELENFPITLKLVQMVEITVVPILPFCTVDRVSVDETPFTLRVAAEMSILEVMKMIEEETGIPVSHQRLQDEQDELEEDSYTLASYEVGDGSTLDLHVEPLSIIVHSYHKMDDCEISQLCPIDTLATLEKLIEEKFGLPPDAQSFKFNDTWKKVSRQDSDNSRTLYEHGIRNESRIVLVPKVIRIYPHDASDSEKSHREKKFGDSTFSIGTFPCKTIAEIKLKIADLKGIPVDKQQLWLASEEPEGLEEVEDGARLVGRHELVEDRAEEQVKAARHHAELDADPRDHLVVRLH